jgi:hypothetical protein
MHESSNPNKFFCPFITLKSTIPVPKIKKSDARILNNKIYVRIFCESTGFLYLTLHKSTPRFAMAYVPLAPSFVFFVASYLR